jgi:hypothetical protein
MSRTLVALRELLRPGAVARSSLPPMEAGLRPNSLLDGAPRISAWPQEAPEDLLFRADGTLWSSAGTSLWRVGEHESHPVVDLGGAVGPIAAFDGEVLAAVEGRGLVVVGDDAAVTDWCAEPSVRSCVTDLTVLPDGEVVVAVGSRDHTADRWGAALMAGDRSGSLVRVTAVGAEVVADGLAWPSGVATAGDGEILVSMSLAHRIERRPLDALAGPGRPMLANLPAYPGRLRGDADGWWVAAPYVRNRATELILDEPDLRADLLASVAQEDWLVPRLQPENPYRNPMQMGQLRVLGVLKPWAPPRSYGLVFQLGPGGRVRQSFHSRVDGIRHGVTGVAVGAGRVVAAIHGARCLVELPGVDR